MRQVTSGYGTLVLWRFSGSPGASITGITPQKLDGEGEDAVDVWCDSSRPWWEALKHSQASCFESLN